MSERCGYDMGEKWGDKKYNLTFSSNGVAGAKGVGYGDKRGHALTLTCKKLVRDNKCALRFLDRTSGPYFSDFFQGDKKATNRKGRSGFHNGFDSDVFDPEFSSPSSEGSNSSGARQGLPNIYCDEEDGENTFGLQDLVDHIVATVRLNGDDGGMKLYDSNDNGEGGSKSKGVKRVVVKDCHVNRKKSKHTASDSNCTSSFSGSSLDEISNNSQSDLFKSADSTVGDEMESNRTEKCGKKGFFTDLFREVDGRKETASYEPPMDDLRDIDAGLVGGYKIKARSDYDVVEVETRKRPRVGLDTASEFTEREEDDSFEIGVPSRKRRREGVRNNRILLGDEESNSTLLDGGEDSWESELRAQLGCEQEQTGKQEIGEARYKCLSDKEFCEQRVLLKQLQRSHLRPVIIKHGSTVFTMPLAEVLLVIVQEMCEYEQVSHQPRSVEECLSGKSDPFVHYTFPPFEVSLQLGKLMESENGVSAFGKERRKNGYLEPDAKYYEPIVWHLRKVLCGDDEVSYTVVETWLAEILFSPTVKYPICPVFSGPQGIGKSKFFEFITKYVIGLKSAALPMQLDQIATRFNGILEGKMLLVLNETNLNANSRSISMLKTICTEVNQCIENKCKETRVNVACHTRVCMLTNSTDPFKALKSEERRFFIVKTRQTLLDLPYYERLDKIMDNPIFSPFYALHFVGYLRALRQAGNIDSQINKSIPQKYWHKRSVGRGDLLQKGAMRHSLGDQEKNGKFGYDASVLWNKPMTQYMQKKLMLGLSDCMLFLFLFVTCGFNLHDLVPVDELGVRKMRGAAEWKREYDIEMADLKKVKRNYYENAFEIFKMHRERRRGKRNTRRSKRSFEASQLSNPYATQKQSAENVFDPDEEEHLYGLFDTESDTEVERSGKEDPKRFTSDKCIEEMVFRKPKAIDSRSTTKNGTVDLLNNLKEVEQMRRMVDELREFVEKHNTEIHIKKKCGAVLNDDETRCKDTLDEEEDIVVSLASGRHRTQSYLDDLESSESGSASDEVCRFPRSSSTQTPITKMSNLLYWTIEGESQQRQEFYNFSGAVAAFETKYGAGYTYLKKLTESVMKRKETAVVAKEPVVIATTPLVHKKKRGRPRKQASTPKSKATGAGGWSVKGVDSFRLSTEVQSAAETTRPISYPPPSPNPYTQSVANYMSDYANTRHFSMLGNFGPSPLSKNYGGVVMHPITASSPIYPPPPPPQRSYIKPSPLKVSGPPRVIRNEGPSYIPPTPLPRMEVPALFSQLAVGFKNSVSNRGRSD